jgi:hypothetical protein
MVHDLVVYDIELGALLVPAGMQETLRMFVKHFNAGIAG